MKNEFDCFTTFCVDCYDRHLIVCWDEEDNIQNDGWAPSEPEIDKILETRYEQWVHVEENPEVESYCCEEWMLMGLDEIGLKYTPIYIKY